jgi:glutamate racemase
MDKNLKSEISNRSIGIFDSGVGGLTVLKQLLKTLPNENFIYFGDTARLPYGDKSPETIVNYSIENSIFLLKKNIKLLVVACNTASAHALSVLTQIFHLPIVGAIEPGAESAVKASKNGRIAILGTRGTISSRSYESAILHKNPEAFVLPIACPLLVPLIEEHMADHEATKLILGEYLKPIREQRIDTIMLGCTHYPLLTPMIRSLVGEEIAIVDCATACSLAVRDILMQQGIERSKAPDPCRFFVSDDPHKFEKIGQKFLQMPLLGVQLK